MALTFSSWFFLNETLPQHCNKQHFHDWALIKYYTCAKIEQCHLMSCYRCYRSIHWSDMFSSNLCTDLFQSQLRSFCFQSITCQECWIVSIDCVHLLNDLGWPRSVRVSMSVKVLVTGNTNDRRSPTTNATTWMVDPMVEMVKSYNRNAQKMMEMVEKTVFFQKKSWKNRSLQYFLKHSVVRTVHFHGIDILKLKNMKNTQHCNNNISMIVGLENYTCKNRTMSLNVT